MAKYKGKLRSKEKIDIFHNAFKVIAKNQLVAIESRSKKYPCSVRNREIQIAKENIEEAFGKESNEMKRLKKVISKRNNCKK